FHESSIALAGIHGKQEHCARTHLLEQQQQQVPPRPGPRTLPPDWRQARHYLSQGGQQDRVTRVSD
ncbi:hypothetical protein, partial [Providencia stuartii]|uniref:hypothetical protein n=1 Tax=Providencia stuartii TaxID=588 RepID=UPI001EF88C7B